MKIYGKVGCSRAYAIRNFLHRNDVPFEWIELKTDDQCRAIGIEPTEDLRTPVCVFADGTRMECPTVRQIIDKLGWFHDPQLAEYDLGDLWRRAGGIERGGVCGVRRVEDGVDRALGDWRAGGEQSEDRELSGISYGISGADLAERARDQARKFGAEILLARDGVRGGVYDGGRRRLPCRW